MSSDSRTSVVPSYRSYFSAPANSFWRWSPQFEAVVTRNGDTIAFRQELDTLIDSLATDGLPPFETILLVLLALRGNAREILPQLSLQINVAEMQFHVTFKNAFVDLTTDLLRFSELAEDLRTSSQSRRTILALISENLPRRHPIELSAACVNLLRDLLYQLDEGDLIAPARSTAAWHQEIRHLRDALACVTDSTVRTRMHTGVEILPDPSPITLELLAQETDAEPQTATVRQLLKELESDDDHQGLARLTRRMSSLVTLPRPLAFSDDQPLGGISDITNRGEFDRLLLSELAHDPDILMTRVALNEALYLRREVPPSTPPQCRRILIDNGIRTWGLPRIFATSTALAFALQSESRAGVGSAIEFYYMHTGHPRKFNPAIKAELLEFMAQLGLETHPGQLLTSVTATMFEPAELIVITTPESLQDIDFRQHLQQLKHPAYLISVSRDGDYQIAYHSENGDRPIATAKIELEQILSESGRVSTPAQVRTAPSPGLPALCQRLPFPLNLSHQFSWDQSGLIKFHNPEIDHFGLLSVTRDRRLTISEYMASGQSTDYLQRVEGPTQVTDRLPKGHLLWHQQHVMGNSDTVTWRLIVGSPTERVIYLVLASVTSITICPLNLNPGSHLHISERDGLLYIYRKYVLHVFDGLSGKFLHTFTASAVHTWLSGGLYRSGDMIYAYSPSTNDISSEPVGIIPPGCQPLQVFESASLHGPVGIFSDGSFRRLASPHEPLTFKEQRHYISQNDTNYRSLPRWTFESAGGSSQVEVISPDGDDIIISSPLPSYPYRKWLVSLADLTAIETHGDADLVLKNRRFLGTPHSCNLRGRLKSVAIVSDALLLESRTGTLQLCHDPQTKRLLLRKVDLQSPDVQWVPFQRQMASSEVGYSLHQAQFPNGSTATIDSRGLLHLKSTDSQLPEIALVLNDDWVSLWTSDGSFCGDVSVARAGEPMVNLSDVQAWNLLTRYCRGAK